MSPDLLGGYLEDPQTLNKYVYVRNNPLKLTDPTGLDFYEQCADTKNHKNCTQVTVGSGKDETKVWVQANNGNAIVVTSDSIRAGQNSAAVTENGVQINGKYQGVYFDNPASKDANGDSQPDHPAGFGCDERF